jgi:hypothetical protein
MSLLLLWASVACYRVNSKMNSILLHFKRFIVTLYFGRCVCLRRNFTFFQLFHRWHVCRSLSSVPFLVYIRPKKQLVKSNCSACMQLHFKTMWCNERPKIWHNYCRREEKFRSHFPQKNLLAALGFRSQFTVLFPAHVTIRSRLLANWAHCT